MSIKRFFLAALALVLLATPVLMSANLSAHAAPPRQTGDTAQHTITVTGTGIAYGKPDIVSVGLGVESVNADIMTAMNETNDRLNAVLQSLQDAGVAPEDIRTEYYSIYQDYSGPAMDATGQPERQYRVSSSVAVTVRDPNRIGELLSAAVQAGANLVNYVTFDIQDRTSLKSAARQDAVTDARARAEELASLLGVTVGDPVQIVEGNNMGGPIPYGMGGGGGGAAASVPTISQGQLSVSMVVTITYAVQ